MQSLCNWRNAVNAAFVVACATGCAIQAVYMTTLYLSYETRPATQVIHTYEIEPPAVSVCGEYESMILANELERMFGKDVERNVLSLTLNQLFQLVPQPKDILLRCSVNIPNKQRSYGRVDGKQVCNQLFRVVRFYGQHNMCYNLELRRRFVYNFYRIAQEDRGRMYELQLDRRLFENVTHWQVALSDQGLPVMSRYYATLHKRLFTDRASKRNKFRYTYGTFKYKRLPPPYDTNCSGAGYAACNTKCFVELVMKHYNKLPSEWMLPENPISYVNGVASASRAVDAKTLGNYDLPFVKEGEIVNNTFYREYNRLYDHCARTCKTHACEYKVYSTTLLAAEELDTDAMAIYIYLPLSPATEVTFHPRFPINDYLIYIMSCLGTWLGLSVINMNPVKFLDKRQRRAANNRNYINPYDSRLFAIVSQLKGRPNRQLRTRMILL